MTIVKRMRVAELLREFRRRTRTATREIGEATGVTHPVVMKWVAGTMQPRLDQAVKLARLLECSLNDLAGIADGVPLSEGDRTVLEAYHGSGLTPLQAANAIQERGRELRLNSPPAAPAGEVHVDHTLGSAYSPEAVESRKRARRSG